MVYLLWKADPNALQTTKSNVSMNVAAGVDGGGLGGGYARERERKLVTSGEVSIGPGQSTSVALATPKIFVTISTESGVYVGQPPCIFRDRLFSAKSCAGYFIRERKFCAHPPPGFQVRQDVLSLFPSGFFKTLGDLDGLGETDSEEEVDE